MKIYSNTHTTQGPIKPVGRAKRARESGDRVVRQFIEQLHIDGQLHRSKLMQFLAQLAELIRIAMEMELIETPVVHLQRQLLHHVAQLQQELLDTFPTSTHHPQISSSTENPVKVHG